MSIKLAAHYFARLILAIATATMLLAFAEGFAEIFGHSLVFELYSPGRLLELAASLLVFVVTILLVQIRDELKNR